MVVFCFKSKVSMNSKELIFEREPLEKLAKKELNALNIILLASNGYFKR